MNTTEVFYDDGQKVALAFSFVPCILVSYLLYKYSKQELHGSQTIDKSMVYFYNAIGGSILGQLIFHIIPNGIVHHLDINYALMSIFVFLGLFVMLCVQRCARVNSEMQHHTDSSGTTLDVKHTIIKKTVSRGDYFEATELEEQLPDNYFKIIDEDAEIRKRRQITTVFYIILVIGSILEGYILVINKTHGIGGIGLHIGMWYANKLLQTFMISVMSIYAMFHVTNEKRPYIGLTGFWILVCLLSTIPILSDTTTEFSESTMNNNWMAAFYAFMGGVLWWISGHVRELKFKKTTKKETTIGLILFLLFGIISYITGIFV